MGRVDEALRRSKDPATLNSEIGTGPQAGLFVAPWKFSPAAVPTSDDTDRGPARLLGRDDRDTLLLREVDAGFSRTFNPEWLDRSVVSANSDPQLVEQFRGLAATLHRAQSESNLKVVMVTSADPGEGKTFTALNLALILSESLRRRVLLIDADLRRPSIARIAQIADGPGLSEGLKSRTEQKLPLFKLTELLTLLPAGRPDPDPMAGLTSPHMRQILDEAAARYDWVVLDAPPVGPIADAGLLAAMVDGAILVVRSERTQYASVQHAIEAIGRQRILGVVLNGVSKFSVGTYGYGGNYRA